MQEKTEIISKVKRTARYHHVCTACNTMIWKGECYEVTTALTYEGISRIRKCSECMG